jgi:hypothetical protein
MMTGFERGIAQSRLVVIDGQIKAPPSVGLHVVGFIQKIATAL